ncbi:DUF6412 domain-containing protein [Pseudonocardia spinosispora]|uniref:DUF6412 domain-containing protein n=1 Tax=Pseudonocardia spinosispora TaxID=103441 RepID=UPI0004906016|nr:DUF6412 domain-containing protein [Pseudonocardia spinosispora]
MRWMGAALALVLVMLAAPHADGSVVVLGAAIATMLAAAWMLRSSAGRTAVVEVGPPDRPSRDERCLRGSFRRQSSPDTPGRPRLPRAPGRGHRPA